MLAIKTTIKATIAENHFQRIKFQLSSKIFLIVVHLLWNFLRMAWGYTGIFPTAQHS
jgi:hypothetical protein